MQPNSASVEGDTLGASYLPTRRELLRAGVAVAAVASCGDLSAQHEISRRGAQVTPKDYVTLTQHVMEADNLRPSPRWRVRPSCRHLRKFCGAGARFV